MTWRRAFHPASLILGVLSTAIVLGSVYVDIQDTSPGTISAAHAGHPKFGNGANCAICHGDETQTMSDACLDCHREIMTQLRDVAGFHGRLDKSLASKCSQCHSDHHGTDFQITNKRSFELAGISDPSQFDHAGVNYQLTGKHTGLACSRCHPHADKRHLAAGEQRFTGLTQACAACHEDVHKGSYGRECVSCHGQDAPFARAAAFVHTRAFELVGKHRQAACAACHEKNTDHAVVALLGLRNDTVATQAPVRTCGVCHASPHAAEFELAVAQHAKVSNSDVCEVCHDDAHSAFHAPDASMAPALHALTGFALDAPHDKAQCVNCHPQFGTVKETPQAFAASFPGRSADDCQACHGDPHQGQFQQGTLASHACLDCHERHSFRPATFDLVHHNQTAFPLHGAHESLECDACHRSTSVVPQTTQGTERIVAKVFRGTPTACRECHVDPHQGQFSVDVRRRGDCSVCHDEHSFQQSRFDAEAHAALGFPLTGAHVAVGCYACHVESLPSSDGAPGRHVFAGTPTECAACHPDVHDGAFDQPGIPQVWHGQRGCARCHTTTSFHEVRADDFDHEQWTGYPLVGVHARASCADCHQRRHTAGLGRELARLTDHRCDNCHSDPHAGQFGMAPAVDCARCHLEGFRFSELRFDHQRHSAFPLDDTHARLACNACHKQQTLVSGRTAVRYKPLGTTCGDCHVPTGPRP